MQKGYILSSACVALLNDCSITLTTNLSLSNVTILKRYVCIMLSPFRCLYPYNTYENHLVNTYLKLFYIIIYCQNGLAYIGGVVAREIIRVCGVVYKPLLHNVTL